MVVVVVGGSVLGPLAARYGTAQGASMGWVHPGPGTSLAQVRGFRTGLGLANLLQQAVVSGWTRRPWPGQWWWHGQGERMQGRLLGWRRLWLWPVGVLNEGAGVVDKDIQCEDLGA